MVGIGLASFVNAYVFPVPDRIIEGFAEVFTADQLPLWQLLFFGALMPALFEELAFRGLLLNGLVQRLRPWTTCLVVGAVFGLFHVAVFRILPTAYMGVVLAAVVLMTASSTPRWSGTP